MEINWLKATEDERKQLYIVSRAVADAADISMDNILDAATGRRVLMGTDYILTFRRGKIRRSYAKLIYGWIAEHHSEVANSISPDLFPKRHANAWGKYLDDNAIQGKLRIARFGKKSMGLVERKRKQPKPEEILKLGEEFCFQLESDIDGYAVAFQEYEGTIHPLPLELGNDLGGNVQSGEQFLPVDDQSQPEKLTEASDLGYHRFVIAIAMKSEELPTEATPPDIGGNVVAHIVRVQFVA